MQQSSSKPQKRIFITLLSFSVFLVMLLPIAIYYFVVLNRHFLQNAMFPLIYGSILGLFILGVTGGIIIIRNIHPTTSRLVVCTAKRLNNLLYPLIVKFGHLVGFSGDEIKKSFIEVNNFLIDQEQLKFNYSDVLILAPHCLQKSDCPHRVTRNSSNCKRCGKCQINELLNIQEQYGINIAVAPGGTSAKMFIQKQKPKAVIAIACENDLAAGIQECGSLPVYGILNSRPNGPCHETTVSIEEIHRLLSILSPGNSPVLGQQLTVIE